jgi:ABC-type transport system involved in multi-copper enzyme maturation permease subunit
MKTIIRKELRENFKLAVIGFGIFTFLLVEGYRSCSQYFTQLAFGQTSWQFNNAHPLLSASVLSETALFCAIFGALLGWLQIHNERHRDLWAFLIHRPISRSEIFFGKVIAGLCLYMAGTALPLLGYIVIAWMPGHFPVPFGWPMVLPLTARFLIGMVFYFGGLLTGIRQARWYASRALGLGAGFILLVISIRAPEFWRVLLFLVPGILITGAAAWGSFISGGYYEGQTGAGRRALVASLMLGCFMVISFVTTLLMSLLGSPYSDSWTNYQIGKDGTVYKSTRSPGKTIAFTDLNGVPLLDKNGRPMLQNDFYKIVAPASYVTSDFDTNAPVRYYSNDGFNGNANYFTLWRQTVDTLWYWCPNGRLWGYDMMSRRFIGSLGPDGFAPDASTGPARFSRMEGSYGNDYYAEWYPARTLMTDTALYELDYDNRTSKLFFATTNNERIGAAVDVTKDMNAGIWDYTVVVTKDSVRLLTPDGKPASQIPYEPKYPSYAGIYVYFLQPTNKFVYWFNPNYETNRLLNWTLPSHLVWAAGDQGIIKTLDLPSTERTWHEPFMDRLVNVVMPPASSLISPFAYWGNFSTLAIFWKDPDFWVSVDWAIICAGVGWGLGRRYYFTGKAQMKWVIFNLFFGLPGLMAFICTQEWPAREACPNCKKLRMVDREHCEHCGAEFPPPPKTGTEIFEPVGAK